MFPNYYILCGHIGGIEVNLTRFEATTSTGTGILTSACP